MNSALLGRVFLGSTVIAGAVYVVSTSIGLFCDRYCNVDKPMPVNDRVSEAVHNFTLDKLDELALKSNNFSNRNDLGFAPLDSGRDIGVLGDPVKDLEDSEMAKETPCTRLCRVISICTLGYLGSMGWVTWHVVDCSILRQRFPLLADWFRRPRIFS